MSVGYKTTLLTAAADAAVPLAIDWFKMLTARIIYPGDLVASGVAASRYHGGGVPGSPVGGAIDRSELAAAEDGCFGYRSRISERMPRRSLKRSRHLIRTTAGRSSWTPATEV